MGTDFMFFPTCSDLHFRFNKVSVYFLEKYPALQMKFVPVVDLGSWL